MARIELKVVKVEAKILSWGVMRNSLKGLLPHQGMIKKRENRGIILKNENL